MFCKKCGNEMPDNMNFCTRCGSPLNPPVSNKQPTEIPVQPVDRPIIQPQVTTPNDTPAPEQPKKAKNKTAMIIVAVVAAIAIVVVGIVIGIGIGKNGGSAPENGQGYVDNEDDSDNIDESTEPEEDTTQTTEPEIVYLEATNEDFDLMLIFASEMIYLTDEYNCTEDDANAVAVSGVTDLFSNMYYICMEEYNFQEPYQSWNNEGAVDPERRYTDEYDGHIKYKASDVDWVVRNIYNVEPVMTEYFTDDVNTEDGSEYCVWYRKGDYYYSHLFASGRESGYKSEIISKERTDDGKYKIRLNVVERAFDEQWPVGTYEVVVGLKEVDGKRVWSFEKWYEV